MRSRDSWRTTLQIADEAARPDAIASLCISIDDPRAVLTGAIGGRGGGTSGGWRTDWDADSDSIVTYNREWTTI